MIGSLDGVIEYIDHPYVIVKIGGVGYKVLLSQTILQKLKINQKIKLFTYTYVREDALDLFGFESLENLKLFENLIGVSGVGPKTAINIFNFGDETVIKGAILKGDVDFFTKVPRLGRKNAQKIIIDLRSKLGNDQDLDLTEEDKKTELEITQALKVFGFTTLEAKEAIKGIKNEGKTTEEKIRLALKYLGK
jgi:holliday junction DNA helicase RuvA